MKRGLIFTLTACVLLSMLYCPPIDLWYDDKQIFRYAGLLLYKGSVPYRDFFDHKPPLIYFFNCAGLLLGSWGLWIIDTLLMTGASLLFYRLCRQKNLAWAPLLPLLFNLLIRNYLVCEGIGMTRAYTAIFLLMAFCILMGESRYKFFWLGLLTGATLLMQQDQLLPLLPFLVYALWTARHRPASAAQSLDPVSRLWPLLLQQLAQSLGGFLTIVAPVLLYFGLHHALTAFWHDAFLFNFSWYTEGSSFIEKYRAVKAGLRETDTEMPLMICLTIGISALFVKTSNKRLLIAALLAIPLAFGPEAISGRSSTPGSSFYYYFLSLSAVLPILIFAVWTSSNDSFFQSRKSQAVFGFLLCFSLSYNAVQRATHLTFRSENMVSVTPEYQYLRQQSLADYQLYILGNNNWAYAYNECRILSPSPWIYHHFWSWYDHWDNDHKILASIGQDLLRHQTRYVVDFSATGTFVDSSAYTFWKAFLHEHYQPVTLNGRTSTLLWELIPLRH